MLETNFIENPPPYVMADPVQLQQVILNLITNAIEAMSASKQGARILRIETNIDQDRFRRDHGCGFRTWIRSEGGRATLQAVLHDEIQRHGPGIADLQIDHRGARGKLTVASREPHGAVFRVELPRHRHEKN